MPRPGGDRGDFRKLPRPSARKNFSGSTGTDVDGISGRLQKHCENGAHPQAKITICVIIRLCTGFENPGDFEA